MKKSSSNPVLYLWRKMYKYAREKQKNIKIATGMFVLANMADASQPLIFGFFLDFIQKNGISKSTLPNLSLILVFFLILEIIFWVFWGPARIIEQKTAFAVKKNYKEYLLEGVMALPLAWHNDRHSGHTIDKIEKGTTAIFSFSEETFMFIQAFVRLTISLIALLYFNLYASAVVIFTSVFIFYIMFTYDKKLIPGYKKVNAMENKTSEKVYDILSNITTVIILRIENLVFKSISRAIDTPFPQFKRNALNNEWKWAWAATLGQLSVVVTVVVYLLTEINAGKIVLIGSVYILYSYASRVRETFFSFAMLYGNAVKWCSNIANAEEITEDFLVAEFSHNKYLPPSWSLLSVKNLSFSYHEEINSDLHLDDVNMNLYKGEKIALIGESGGGKTTFLKMLRGLYLPKEMQLQIDKRDYGQDFNSISDSISLIPQDPETFSTTIRENITLGVDYEEEEIKIFTDMASFTNVIERLPRGLESSIVERGVNLSGGEKQRLALARGLLASRDKEIILLDEPTSSVDFHNELQIYENIFTAMPEKTIISSIHRLHLLPLFDNIFFFKEGKIIARGNVAKLKEKSKDFQDLWEKYLKTQNQ